MKNFGQKPAYGVKFEFVTPPTVPRYESAGLMKYFGGAAADKLSGEAMIADLDRAA